MVVSLLWAKATTIVMATLRMMVARARTNKLDAVCDVGRIRAWQYQIIFLRSRVPNNKSLVTSTCLGVCFCLVCDLSDFAVPILVRCIKAKRCSATQPLDLNCPHQLYSIRPMIRQKIGWAKKCWALKSSSACSHDTIITYHWVIWYKHSISYDDMGQWAVTQWRVTLLLQCWASHQWKR